MPRRAVLRAMACALALSLAPHRTHAQPAAGLDRDAGKLTLLKVDPPNWWADMPKPMLLVRGEGLSGASFALSDPALRIENMVISANGHWAQLWLAASPAQPETVTLQVKRGAAHVTMPYTFAARRAGSDGFAGFSSNDVLYLIMTDRFADGDRHNDGADASKLATSAEAIAERAKPRGWHGGDLRGVLDHLDYLQQLGATAVWITPVYVNHEPEAYHGYHATDYYGVDPHYGTLADLQALAAALHARGMKLVLDTVPNHVGPAHPWVTDEPSPVWFHGTAAHHLAGKTNFASLVDPHAPERDRLSTLDGWFVDQLPDMNTDDPVVAQYLRQNAVWWIEQTAADGLRIDTFPYVDRPFWNAFDGELKSLFPSVTEVGEIANPDPVITSAFADGTTTAGIDTRLYTPFDFPLYDVVLKVFAHGEPMDGLADVLAADSLYPHPERLVTFLGNHDTARFAQKVTDPGLRRLAFAFLLTTRGMPQIYSGDELATMGGDDPDDRRDFPGGFPGDPQSAFATGGKSAAQQAMFSWVARLAALRRQDPALGCGAEQVLASDTDWLVYLRDTAHAAVPCNPPNPPRPAGALAKQRGGQRVVVALHRGQAPGNLDLSLDETWAAGCRPGKPLLGAPGSDATVASGKLRLQMAGDDTLIFACQ